MNEKALQILEQYDLEVLRSYGGRGGIMLETKDGLKMIKEFAGSRAKLPLEQRVLGILAERGVCAVDQVQANKEGELVTMRRPTSSRTGRRGGNAIRRMRKSF